MLLGFSGVSGIGRAALSGSFAKLGKLVNLYKLLQRPVLSRSASCLGLLFLFMQTTASTVVSQEPRIPGHLPMFAGLLLAVLLLGLTWRHWVSETQTSLGRRQQAFTAAVDRNTYSIRDQMGTLAMMLRGVKGYYDGSESIDREEFHAYVAALSLEDTLPGLQAVAYAPRLVAGQVQAHELEMHSKGFRRYAVQPAGDRAYFAPLSYIEPLTGRNLKALGFDISTVPATRDALERARDTGKASLSAALTLRQDAGRKDAVGVVMYLPIYTKPSDPDTVEGRRRALFGWISAPIRIHEMLQGMTRQLDPDIDLSIRDVGASEGLALLYGNSSAGDSDLHETRLLDIGGRTWELSMRALPHFEQRFKNNNQAFNAMMGVMLSLMVGGLIWFFSTARVRAMTLAHRMTQALRSTRDDLESTLNAIPDLLFELDQEGRIHHFRSARSGLLELAPEMFLGQRLIDLVAPEAVPGCRTTLQAAMDTGYSAGHQYRMDLGAQSHWFELSIARKDGIPAGQGQRFVAIARDITERKQAEARTHQLAYFDTLTALPNRRMLLDRLEHALASARKSGQVGALFFIDLDNFKQINDARGHTLGDALLVQVAQRLTGLVPVSATVARLGGDEFVLLLNNLALDMHDAGREALLMGETIRSALEDPYTIEGRSYDATASIGITLFPKEHEEVEDLLREGDTAMYRAKDLGRNRISFYEAAMQADAQERLALEQDLKKAKAEGQLAVYVQPQVNAAGTVVGGELLMRWNHPVRGSVPPSCFIPVAESSGLILRMGDWMIEQACEALARLEAAQRVVSLSVNVSERQFRQDDFVERVRGMLERTGAPPEHLILEVTESLLIENLDKTVARMTELVQMGLRFSIDDFGTGYSSLAYLKKLPIFELKIDKSFVQDTPGDPNGTAIVESILAVARHLKLRVVAEGVETSAQAEFLASHDCDCLQGYFFGRPEPLEPWLQRRLTSV